MDRFPPELLHNVFIRLDLSERLICTLVCHKWWSVLDMCSLLCDVEIKSKRQFIRFMDMIKQSPHREAQVEVLTIYCCFEDGSVKRNLCNMFQNVRIINLDCKINHYHSSDFSKPVETAQTTSKVRHITDISLCKYASQMMTSNLCGQLLSLHLDFKDLSISWGAILPQMKNMPILEQLILYTRFLSIADIELVHKNIPSIQDLRLDILEIQDSEMPPAIIPTTQLATMCFEIGVIDDLEIHMKWYRYVAQKYTSVTTWDHHDRGFMEEEDSQFIYENGYLEFLELIAPTQTKLALDNIPENINVFEVLDSRDCRIIDFSLQHCPGETPLQNLAQSKMSKYIEKLTVCETELGLFHHFQNFTMLTTLELYYALVGNSNKINLTDCLNSLLDTLKEPQTLL